MVVVFVQPIRGLLPAEGASVAVSGHDDSFVTKKGQVLKQIVLGRLFGCIESNLLVVEVRASTDV